MIPYAPDEIMVIAGMRGSGKTTLAKYIINQLKNFVKIVIFDVNGEYGDLNDQNVRIVIPFRYDETEIEEFLDKLMRKALELNEWIVAVIEESDLYFNVFKPLTDNRARFVHRGRHFLTGGIFLTRRLASLHKDVVAQASTLISFKQILPNDVNYLQQFVEKAEMVMRIPEHSFITWRNGKFLGVYEVEAL